MSTLPAWFKEEITDIGTTQWSWERVSNRHERLDIRGAGIFSGGEQSGSWQRSGLKLPEILDDLSVNETDCLQELFKTEEYRGGWFVQDCTIDLISNPDTGWVCRKHHRKMSLYQRLDIVNRMRNSLTKVRLRIVLDQYRHKWMICCYR